ncbi:hypothetical protein [Novilysobacter antarcticus]|uniref:hypothetical protein n=1 Tax=Novilysobacter antarcticus TaxID=2862543 RepID=UPI001C998827|nr:hypothetical protein [Lysobacter antarcticus]
MSRDERVYICGISLGILWDVVQLSVTWSNPVLRFAGIATLLITAFGWMREYYNINEIGDRWMLAYLIPAAIIFFGLVGVFYDIQNAGIRLANGNEIQRAVPRADYAAAVISHYLSMAIPLISLGIASLVGWFKGRRADA